MREFLKVSKKIDPKLLWCDAAVYNWPAIVGAIGCWFGKKKHSSLQQNIMPSLKE